MCLEEVALSLAHVLSDAIVSTAALIALEEMRRTSPIMDSVMRWGSNHVLVFGSW
jgi:hypothetical protein